MHICSYIIANMRHMDWDDLRFFLAVASAGSLSAAARALNVNTTTVLRRIANLEQALDARLFERLRSGYELTPDGTRLLETLGPVGQRGPVSQAIACRLGSTHSPNANAQTVAR